MAVLLKEQELQTQALGWPAKAKAIAIVDQSTYNRAAGLKLGLVDLRKQIVEHHADPKKKAFDAHKAIVAAEKRMLDPITEAEGIVNRSLAVWEREQEQKRLESERLVREAKAKLEEEMRLQAATEAEQDGAPDEVVEEILDTPIPLPDPVVAPTYTRVAGAAPRAKNWHAEVVDIKALCRAVADGTVSPNYVEANLVALNARARAEKSSLVIPGIKAVQDQY